MRSSSGGRLRQVDWVRLMGYLLFVGALSAGYFYNLTFVQLGLVDLGTRVLGLSPTSVTTSLAALAGLTLVMALAAGFAMHRRGWSQQLMPKLRILSVAVVLQTILTPIAPLLRNEASLVVWIVFASVALGLGIPSMFGLTCDLIAARHRGAVAALVTSAAFVPAVVLSSNWRIDEFAGQLVVVMVPGAVGIAVLAFVPLRLTATLARQHELPGFGTGRLVRGNPAATRPPRGLVIAIVVMFWIYFVDSLGFLRIVDTPAYVGTAWQSHDPSTLWIIAAAHVGAALIAGVLYPALGHWSLIGWTFVLFALAQLSYALHALTTPDVPASLGPSVLYAMAVSIYTVLNFALWADFSTPATIARNTALGVGISGWLATFLSTALSIWWRSEELPLADHLRAVAAISLLLLVVTLALTVLTGGRASADQPGERTRP